MVDNCKHVLKLSPASNHSVLNPQKWACITCSTTESVWACLSCPNVACGRFISEHALQHYEVTKHPLSLEVNDKYVYCYECADYVLNDNAAGDLKILRSALSAVTAQSLKGVSRRSKRILRSASFGGIDVATERQLLTEDRNYTVLWFRRYYQLAKAFSAWKQVAGIAKKADAEEEPSAAEAVCTISSRKKRALVPGVTGLRNLGNTCYMNSVLQVLSHLKDFRKFFLQLKNGDVGKLEPPEPTTKRLRRQTTMECFQYLADTDKKGGLNGGSSASHSRTLQSLARNNDKLVSVSLCQELHALLRVMWSGKWALVSPHKMLYAVWNIIPFFRGYSQQDAQEFLCEFLDKVSTELDLAPGSSKSALKPRPTPMHSFQDIVTSLFQGQLISEVTCQKCQHKSETFEAFMDLSLEFPRQHQATGSKCLTSQPCHLEDMLSRFTAVEKLDGRIYACEQCNRRRRRVAARPTVLTQAHKRFSIHKLPHVLRLHLKRFMWSDRNNRGKITVHAQFEQQLDLRRFCHTSLQANLYLYQLAAVVMHHGRGFGSGHYTAYCWNEEADSWMHCNDAKMQVVTVDEVMRAQAYILFYVRRKVDIPETELAVPLNDKLFERVADNEITFNFKNSSIPRYVELKRKLHADGARGQRELKRRRSNMW